MLNYLVISIFSCIFATWIGGSHEPLTRVIQQPFHVCNCWNHLIVGNMKRLTQEEFIARARKVHGDKYDYSKTIYKGALEKVIITCRKHGDFSQVAFSHLNGCGCSKCNAENVGNRKRMNQQEFISKASEIHKNKYDYSRVQYKNAVSKVEIYCPNHGVFLQRPFAHLKGQGCPSCVKEKMWTELRHKKTTEEFIKEARSIHGDFYCYSKTKYEHSCKKIIITCPIHGDFYITPSSHLGGSGCPMCSSSKGENFVKYILDKYGIDYLQQYRVSNESLLCLQKHFFVDFFIPKQNVIIEYNGIQHYKKTDYFHHKDLERQQERDMALRQYCKKHKIKLIEIPYWDYDNIETILKKELKIK